MVIRGKGALALALAGFGVFCVLVMGQGPQSGLPQPVVADRVVLAAPVQVLLAGGDRFLAADFETIRAMATANDDAAHVEASASFRIRAHRAVAQMNPCHEDNYYVANAILSWGGAPSEGVDVLRRATDCRFWDELPPFFYGFNEWFFNRDAETARKAFEVAAQRAADPQQAAAMRRIGIMMEAGEFRDERAALTFLQQERSKAGDDRLREMLDKRVARLEGLMALRDAHARYEEQTGLQLIDPRMLLTTGLLSSFPDDPLGLGYEFADGRFRLREISIPGFERRQ